MKLYSLFLLGLYLGAQALPDFYHSSADIRNQMYELSRECQGMRIKKVSSSPDVEMITFNEHQNKPYKGFVLFGEHARELISPESGLHMLKSMCNQETDNEIMKSVRDNYELRMILNLNPISRQKVEEGNYCLRVNENGVDINRNYGAHWNEYHDDKSKVASTNVSSANVAPGPFAFSERETQIVRDQLTDFKPNVFFSIHSGTLGLYAPYAYTSELAKDNLDNTLEVLAAVHDQHCHQCKVGSCGQQVGYLAPGTSMDYAYDDLKIQYSFTFEIFNGDIDLRKQPPQDSFLQVQTSDKNEQIKQNQINEDMDNLLRTHSCFAESSTQILNNDQCLGFFNPIDKDQYDYYIDNWSNAILLGLSQVAIIEQKQNQK